MYISIMEAQKYLGFVVVIVLMAFLGSSEARYFRVGGDDGWVLRPSEGLSHWAKRNRFHVNDSLIFKYKEGSDSVLVVERNAYYKCTQTNPIQNLTNGYSVFKFNQSGPFFFISGESDHCLKGQKLEVVVMAVRNATHEPPAESPSHPWTFDAPAPAPSAAPAYSGGGGMFSVGLSTIGLALFFRLF